MGESHVNCCAGGSASASFIPYSDTKHELVLVDSDAAHRGQVAASLMSLYNVVEFALTTEAADYISAHRPGIVVVADESAPRGGYELVRDLRNNRKLRALPIVMILTNDQSGSLASVRECGADGWVVKPYKRSELVRLISHQFNASIEAKWEHLPPVQAQALKGTVELFNSFSDVIDKGEPIVYSHAKNACEPLVEAVNSGDFRGILSGVRDHDNYTYAHSMRVAVFLSLFGKAIGLPREDQKLLATGGLLHDVGKMFIPHLVLNKPGRLTEEEFAIMKGHVDATTRLLEGSPDIPKGVITIASQHHEKLDGSGYPRGLAGAELNDLARMASIVDVFSALTDRRVYKPSMMPETALTIMHDEMAHHLDMSLLSRFRQMLLDAAVTD